MTTPLEYVDIVRQGNEAVIDPMAYNRAEIVNANIKMAREYDDRRVFEEAYVEQVPVTEGLMIRNINRVKHARRR